MQAMQTSQRYIRHVACGKTFVAVHTCVDCEFGDESMSAVTILYLGGKRENVELDDCLWYHEMYVLDNAVFMHACRRDKIAQYRESSFVVCVYSLA